MSPLYRWLADNTHPRSVSAAARRRRFRWFRETMRLTPEDRILDVGGAGEAWTGSGLEGQVTLLNLDPAQAGGPIRNVVGDACDMDMFGPAQFDVAFSNSVIEHVGDWRRQQRFAAEVKRVARRYWVQTPWRHFPIEPHMLFPLFQYLPPAAQRAVATRWKYSHFHRYGQDVLAELALLRLLTASEMRALFPDSTLRIERVLGIPKSVIAYRR